MNLSNYGIKLDRIGIENYLIKDSEVTTLGQVIAEQAAGLLIAVLFPRVMRISKHALECAGNLLRRPVSPKVTLNQIKESRVCRDFGPTPSRLMSPPISATSNVNSALGGTALCLTTDRRAATIKHPNNYSDARILDYHLCERGSVLSIEMSLSLY